MTTYFQNSAISNLKRVAGSIKLLFCFSFLILCSCTAPIDIDTDNSKPVIVINGILTDENKQQEVRISYSSPYFQNKPNVPVSNAVVTIRSSANEMYELKENDSIPGLYQTLNKWSVVEGTSYYLHVQVDFNQDGTAEVYDAETTVLHFAGLDSIQLSPINIMGYAHFALDLYGQDDPDHEFYLFKFIVNDSLVTNKLSQYYTFDDIAFNGEYIDGLTLEYFESTEIKDEFTEEQQKNMIFLGHGDKMTLCMSKIPKGYHDFINQCQKERRGENPFFGGPASNITTNISNGGVGYFSGYRITKSSTTTP